MKITNYETGGGISPEGVEAYRYAEPMIRIPDFPGAPRREDVLRLCFNPPPDPASTVLIPPGRGWELRRDPESSVWIVVQHPPLQVLRRAKAA